MLIGGFAMGAYGHMRGTNDLDIFVNASEDNADKMISACIEYGITSDNLKREMFLVPKMIGIGKPPLTRIIHWGFVMKALSAIKSSA